MRLAKAVNRKEGWFDVPGDADGARICVRDLSPGERAKVRSKAMPMEFKPGDSADSAAPTVRIDQHVDAEMTAAYALKDWENFFEDDAGEKAMKATPDNKRMILDGAVLEDGKPFREFVLECWRKVSEQVAEARETERKNSKK